MKIFMVPGQTIGVEAPAIVEITYLHDVQVLPGTTVSAPPPVIPVVGAPTVIAANPTAQQPVHTMANIFKP